MSDKCAQAYSLETKAHLWRFDAMTEFDHFVVALIIIACAGSSDVACSIVRVMSPYTRVDNDLINSTSVSLIGCRFTSSFGQCSNTCNLQGSNCDGFLFEVTPGCSNDDPTKTGFCQLVTLVEQSVDEFVYSPSQRLYVRNYIVSTVTTGLLWVC